MIKWIKKIDFLQNFYLNTNNKNEIEIEVNLGYYSS